jgi:hypothetical protein
MSRWTVFIAALVFIGILVISCSGNGTNSPVTPNGGLSTTDNSSPKELQKQLWGYYDLHFDFANGTVESVVNRSVMFNANVVEFINGNPAGLTFPSLDVDVTDPNFVGVDIDVAIAHPLPDAAYNGYDVLGVFIGDGSRTLSYMGGKTSEPGTDQSLTNADGLTRWFNPGEFGVPGVLGYTPGLLATSGYTGTSTINPYKLFADDLGADDDAYGFVAAGVGNNVFSAGSTNTRNYLLEFPVPTPNVVFNYAIVASWNGEEPENHPANTTESIVYTTQVTPDIFYVDAGNNGGDLIMDLSLGGYGPQPSTIIVESSVLSANSLIIPSAVVTGGGSTYSTYHIEIPADNITGTTGNYVYVMAEYGSADYSNEFGVPNDASADPLAAYFYFDLFVSDTPYNSAPEISSGVDGETNPAVDTVEQYSVTATDPDLDPLTYEWDLYDNGGGVYVFQDDPGNGDGTIDIDFTGFTAGSFTVSCTVTDGTDDTDATPLDIDVFDPVLYHWDGVTDGAGGLTEDDCAPLGPGTQDSRWAYMGAPNYCWDENGSQTIYTTYTRGVLMTPAFDIPAGVSAVHLRFLHWGQSETGYDHGLLGVTTNGGTSFTWHNPAGTLYTFSSGLNFNNTSSANFGVDDYNATQTCWSFTTGAAHLAKTFSNGVQWGTPGAPMTSDFTFNSLIGTSNVRIAFGWIQDYCCGGVEGWAIREVEVYVTP